MKTMLRPIQNKKALSVMIGYVLLVTFAIIMSAFVYTWMKSYVPKEGLSCPDETSFFVKDSYYNPTAGILNITLKNNGNFNIAGTFVKATTSSTQEIASVDLSKNISSGGINNTAIDGVFLVDSIENFETGKNSFTPGDEILLSFDAVAGYYSIELIPIRYEKVNRKDQVVTCGDGKVEEILVVSS